MAHHSRSGGWEYIQLPETGRERQQPLLKSPPDRDSVVYVYVHVYARMYVCMYMCSYVCFWVCVHVCSYVQVCMFWRSFTLILYNVHSHTCLVVVVTTCELVGGGYRPEATMAFCINLDSFLIEIPSEDRLYLLLPGEKENITYIRTRTYIHPHTNAEIECPVSVCICLYCAVYVCKGQYLYVFVWIRAYNLHRHLRRIYPECTQEIRRKYAENTQMCFIYAYTIFA